MAASLKKFYSHAAVWEKDGIWGVALDGKPIKTPKKSVVTVPSLALAQALAREWQSQGESILPHTLLITRLASTALDCFPEKRPETQKDLLKFTETDLLYYRALSPDVLVARQKALWDPPVQWASRHFGCSFEIITGVMPIQQNPNVRIIFSEYLEALNDFEIVLFHSLTTLSGSFILALSVFFEVLGGEEAWNASVLDEEWQQETWGRDPEFEKQQHARRQEFLQVVSVVQVLALSSFNKIRP